MGTPEQATYGGDVSEAHTYRHPVVNGYSGFSPPHYDVLHLALEAVDQSAIDEIASSSPIVVVVDASAYQGQLWAKELAGRKGAVALGREGTRLVFSIPASGIRHEEAAGRRFQIQSVSANVLPQDAARMIDGDPFSR